MMKMTERQKASPLQSLSVQVVDEKDQEKTAYYCAERDDHQRMGAASEKVLED
jgi:hypothetical protein